MKNINYTLINKERHEALNDKPFNPALDGMATKNTFSNSFATELSDVMTRFSNYFEKHGVYGSDERYMREPSDWWFDEDFYNTSRVLCIDILNPKLQSYKIIQGVQKELSQLKEDWMIVLWHDNDYDRFGELVNKLGEYHFWITKEDIEIYTERKEDINIFLDSLK